MTTKKQSERCPMGEAANDDALRMQAVFREGDTLRVVFAPAASGARPGSSPYTISLSESSVHDAFVGRGHWYSEDASQDMISQAELTRAIGACNKMRRESRYQKNPVPPRPL